MILRLHEDALLEFEEALAWYRERSESAVERFREKLSDALDRIQQTPQHFPIYLLKTRRLLLSPFPYSVIFLIEADRIFVVALAHAKRRPGYWKARLKSH